MSLELVALIITGVVSTFDLVVNVATMCMTGRCRSDCCGFHFEHDEEIKTPRITESQINCLEEKLEEKLEKK